MLKYHVQGGDEKHECIFSELGSRELCPTRAHTAIVAVRL